MENVDAIKKRQWSTIQVGRDDTPDIGRVIGLVADGDIDLCEIIYSRCDIESACCMRGMCTEQTCQGTDQQNGCQSCDHLSDSTRLHPEPPCKVLLKASGSLSRKPLHSQTVSFNSLTEDCNFSLVPVLAFLAAPPDIASKTKEYHTKT